VLFGSLRYVVSQDYQYKYKVYQIYKTWKRI